MLLMQFNRMFRFEFEWLHLNSVWIHFFFYFFASILLRPGIVGSGTWYPRTKIDTKLWTKYFCAFFFLSSYVSFSAWYSTKRASFKIFDKFAKFVVVTIFYERKKSEFQQICHFIVIKQRMTRSKIYNEKCQLFCFMFQAWL